MYLGIDIIKLISVTHINLFIIVLTAFLLWLVWNKRPAHSPPGTNGVPFLGVIPFLRTYPERILTKWGKIYGPLYMVKIGFSDVIVIGTPELAHEAFAKNDCFNDRPDTIPMLDGKGIIVVDSSESQKEHRRFALNTLREFGMGRRTLEHQLLGFSDKVCQHIDDIIGEKAESKPFDISSMIYDNISSVISQIMFGHDVASENMKFRALIQELIEPKSTNVLLGLTVFAPFLRHLPFFSSIWEDSHVYRRKVHAEIMQEIVHHIDTHIKDEGRDFIDCYLDEKEKRNGVHDMKGDMDNVASETQTTSPFSTEHLVAAVRDLFLAGTDTTSSSICWIILYLSKYQEVQKKLQTEIDSVLGSSGLPRMALLVKFPYLKAILQEISRLRPVVPLSVPHKASRTGMLGGYKIPKGAIILTNIWAIHHDETRWPKPETFIPERHLDDEGKFVKSSNWLNFNVGQRNCLGQQLANMELFFSTVTLFRRFHFDLPEGELPDMNGESKISLHPWHFNVVVSRR